MAKIETVIFDAGGVLHETFLGQRAELAAKLNLDETALNLIWATLMPQLGSGEIDEAEFWRRVKNLHGVRQVEVAENLLGRKFGETLKPHGLVRELITELRSQGVKLAVLSNTIEPHARALRAAGVYDGFDYVLLSHELGMRKPDRAIYQLALQRLQAQPESTLFVDDDPVNVEAAEALGMRGVVFRGVDQAVREVRALALSR
jgi:putative hydrolase of the HAD superfamily